MAIIPQYLPDLFSPIVAGMSTVLGYPIYYRWGHREEITKELTELDGSKSLKSNKYPLVWLVMDFDEAKGDNFDVYSKTAISFVFAVGTEINYTEQQRRDKSFLPKLLPMYGEFINQVSVSATFRQPYAAGIKHNFMLRPYWGEGGKNLFNDFVDAIEIRNLKLDVRALTCPPSQTIS